jgi:pseudouridine-5'-phosphate glycosidase
LPGFFTADTGIQLETSVDSAREIVDIYRAHRALGRQQSIVVVQSPPSAHALPRATVEATVAEALADASRSGIRGAAVTPYLLDAVTRLTRGSSLAANLALLEENAGLAAQIAAICSGDR